jgi:hypothetical protein
MVRTIEDILGIGYLNLNDAYQRPMTYVFDETQTSWSYTGLISPYLKGTLIGKTATELNPSVRYADSKPAKPARSAAWWARATRGFDWSDADKISAETGDADSYNRIEWEGVKPGVPYPTHRSGLDLSRHPAVAADGNGAEPKAPSPGDGA